MARPIIEVTELSKSYSIGRRESYGSLRDEIMQALASPFRRKGLSGSGESADTIWALKDVSFEVEEGEVLGIIGRNGAGKSTLLKILSRITEPTGGRITMRGRVASLLEVGTGFHPELTGRENIFLNGALLGMTSAEIRSKFDEIVAFSEIEKFLDTPVKRYSSGMHVRLAFAVAAHLEPEILVVDEVLAVGDTIFQKKCIDKMMEVSSQGRTVLFVSHNFSAVKSFCSRGVLLDEGRLIFTGAVQEAIDAYVQELQPSGREIDLLPLKRRQGQANEIIFEKIRFLDYPLFFGKPIRFSLKLKTTGNKKNFSNLDFGVAIRDRNNTYMIHCSNRFIDKHFEHTSDGLEYIFEVGNILKPGPYTLTLFLRCEEVIQDWLVNAVKIDIEDGNPYNFADTRQIQGLILPEFNIEQVKG